MNLACKFVRHSLLESELCKSVYLKEPIDEPLPSLNTCLITASQKGYTRGARSNESSKEPVVRTSSSSSVSIPC